MKTAAAGSILRAIKRFPVKYGSLILCILLLMSFELWRPSSPRVSRQWNILNLEEINVANQEDFSFAVFGDNGDSKEIFENLLKLIDHDPDIAFAFSLGNTVQHGNKERYRWFLQEVETNLGIPLLTAIGHNEYQAEGPPLYHDILGPLYYSFNVGGNRFIVLDSANGKELDPMQNRWLAGELDKSRDCVTRTVLMHVPLYDPRGGKNHDCLPVEPAESLLALFLKYSVTHVFASHIHGYFEGLWKGVPFSITSGAGAELLDHDPEHAFFHFLKVHIQKGKVHVEVKQVPSAPYEQLGRYGYSVWLYLCSFFRFHGVQTLLLVITAVSAIAVLKPLRRG